MKVFKLCAAADVSIVVDVRFRMIFVSMQVAKILLTIDISISMRGQLRY